MKDLVESFSGIRGIYSKSITEELARQYVLSYLKLLKPEIVVLGYDTRPSSLALKEAVVSALCEGGLGKVIDVGVLPIQATEYSVVKFGADGGIYISASHNEPEYNGFKFLRSDGAILHIDQFNKFIKIAHGFKEAEKEVARLSKKTEIVEKVEEAVKNYLNFILSTIGQEALSKIKNAHLRILVDPNGGSGIVVLKRLFQEMGVAAEIINQNPGQFKRIIEPNAESLKYLAQKMVGGQFEFACGFDCDADRVEYVLNPNSKFVKETSVVLNGNYVLSLACDAVLKGTKNQVVVSTDASSYLIRDVIKKHQATIKEVEVGEINVVQEMERQNSLISGEGSCAGVIVPPIKCRDGIMATALIIKMMAEEGKSLLDILDTYPRYYQMKEKVVCSAEKTLEIKQKLEQYFRAKGYKIQKTGDETGGLKALADDSNFVWFRQSKTEPGAFRIWADGPDKEKVKNLIQQGIQAFNKSRTFKREH